jgi:hypothetical protein
MANQDQEITEVSMICTENFKIWASNRSDEKIFVATIAYGIFQTDELYLELLVKQKANSELAHPHFLTFVDNKFREM